MTQIATVERILDDTHAEISVPRKSACGHDCEECAGCGVSGVSVYVKALNTVGARPGTDGVQRLDVNGNAADAAARALLAVMAAGGLPGNGDLRVGIVQNSFNCCNLCHGIAPNFLSNAVGRAGSGFGNTDLNLIGSGNADGLSVSHPDLSRDHIGAGGHRVIAEIRHHRHIFTKAP